MFKILLLYSNPKGTERLQLQKEIHQIKEDLIWTQVPNIIIEDFGFIKKKDLQTKIQHFQPNIVQFSGHGSEDGEIVVEDEKGNISIVPPTALESVFRNFKETIKCVVLNCCYSELQAYAISEHIPFVIGISNEINDTASRLFSSRFFQSLALGNSIQKSFDIAKTEISLMDEIYEELPKLICKVDCDPEMTYLINKPKILAEFEVLKGKPIINDQDLYEFKISIENAPTQVFSVLYQYMEDEWELPDQVEECKNPHDFFDSLAEDGDIEIRATLWDTTGGLAIRCYLSEALYNFYGKDMSAPIAKAYNEIKAYR